MRVYLAGPINGCSDDVCKTWRELVKEKLPDTLDPMRRDYRGMEDLAFKSIVEGDKDDIDHCGGLLVNCTFGPSYGTAMEILYAWQQKKLIVVLYDATKPVSPWLRYHSTRLITSLEEAVNFLTR